MSDEKAMSKIEFQKLCVDIAVDYEFGPSMIATRLAERGYRDAAAVRAETVEACVRAAVQNLSEHYCEECGGRGEEAMLDAIRALAPAGKGESEQQFRNARLKARQETNRPWSK